MQRTVFVTGADRGLGFALCTGLVERGWCVFAGQYMPEWPELLEAGMNDLGGISPDMDHINPTRPWSPPDSYDTTLRARGYELRRRLPVYDRFLDSGWLSPRIAELAARLQK